MKKRLTINGANKIYGWEFHNRFRLNNVIEMNEYYRWEFIDTAYTHNPMIWIELGRNGVWDGKKWAYPLKYRGLVSDDMVTAGWWKDLGNVKSSFQRILNLSVR